MTLAVHFSDQAVFVGWDCIEAAAWWFAGVETQGSVSVALVVALNPHVQTLEELDDIYNQPYPPFASRKKQAVARRGDRVAIGKSEFRLQS